MHPLLQFFKYEHLPEHIQKASKPFTEITKIITNTDEFEIQKIAFAELSKKIISILPDNIEKDTALNKIDEARRSIIFASNIDEGIRELLEAKDCAVRALFFKTEKA